MVGRIRELNGTSPNVISPENPLWLYFSVTLLTAMVVASLYFMWTVRHPKTE